MIELDERIILFNGKREIVTAIDNRGNKTPIRTIRKNGERIESIYHMDEDYNLTHLFSKEVCDNENKS